MIVRVVVVPPDVGVLVESDVSVDESPHVDVGGDVLKFRVVVEGDRSEGVFLIFCLFLPVLGLKTNSIAFPLLPRSFSTIHFPKLLDGARFGPIFVNFGPN